MPTYNYKIRGIKDIHKILRGPIKREPSSNVIFHKDVVIGGTLYVGNINLMKIQPNIVVRGIVGDNDAVWRNANSSSVAITLESASNDPINVSNHIKFNPAGAHSGAKYQLAWFEFYDRPQDLSFLDYMGFFYKLAAGETYAKEDIKILFFEEIEELSTGAVTSEHAIESYNFLTEDHASEATALWNYSEIPLSKNRESRKRIKAVAIYLGNAADAQTIELLRLEFYKLGTKHGPVRGTVVAVPLAPSTSVSKGDIVLMDENGYVKTPSGGDNNFLGKVCSEQDFGQTGYATGYAHGEESYVYVVVDGIINNPMDTSASGFSSGAGVATVSTTKVGKASGSDPQTQIGVVLRAVPAAGGTYPILIGSRGFVGTL